MSATTRTGPWRRPPTPIITAVVLLVTAAVSVVALLDPSVSGLLTRDGVRVGAGQWWRLVTPIMVQPDGWGQFAFNLAGTAVVGAALERRRTPRVWWVAYLAAGLGSIAVLTVLRPGDVDGGSSNCVAGLVGACAAIDVRRGPVRGGLAAVASAYGAFFCAYLTALDLAGPWPAMIAGDVAVAAVLIIRRHAGRARAADALFAAVVVAGILMAVRLDGHGMGLLTGAAVAVGSRPGPGGPPVPVRS